MVSDAPGATQSVNDAGTHDSVNDVDTALPTAAQLDGGAPPKIISPPSGCEIVASSQIPRLTNAQYGRTIRDLLQVTKLRALAGRAPTELLAPDAEGQLSQQAWDAYRSAAAAIAAEVMTDPASRSGFMACDRVDEACLHDTIIAFGRRAFRRPLTDAEIERFDALVAQGAEITATGSAEEVARVVLETFLISPSFLQRSELSEEEHSGYFLRSNHEIASRLSYAFWGSMPDPELEAAADAGQLRTPEHLLAQARRMLQDDKARDMLAELHGHYLQMGPQSHWPYMAKDPELFAGFGAEVAAAALAETERFFEQVVFTDRGSFADLFLSSTSFVNADTAPLYGLDPADFGAELTLVQQDEKQRPGFLTRIAFLASHASSTRTSPILRGAFISRNILGLDPGVPDPSALSTPLPEDAELDTMRKRVEAQTSGPSCVGCHVPYINPAGFVLETYNAVGAWQTQEADTSAPIETAAEVNFDGQLPVLVTDPADLMAKLAVAPAATKHYVRSWVRYALRRELRSNECVVEQLATRLDPNETTLVDFFADLALTDEFVWRRREESRP